MDKRQFLAGSAAFAGSMVTWSITGHGMSGAEVKASHSVNTTIYAPHMVAVAKGFAKDEGIDLKLTEALGGSKVRKLIAAEQVGYALGDSSHPLQLTNRGKPAKILLASDNRCSYANIIIRKDLADKGINTIEKLAEYKRPDGGKPVVAATGIGSGTWVYGTYVLESFGVNDQFNWVAGGGSKTILGGLKAGKFDAIMAVPAWQFRAQDDGYGVPLYDISDKSAWDKVFGGKIPASVVYVLQETLEDQPELAQKYVNAMVKAMSWLGEADVDEIYSVVGPLMPRFKEPLVKREIAYYKKIWQYDASFPKEDFANGAKVWFRKKTKIKPLEYEDVADMSFLNKAKTA
ncbi:MAG: ABC transporter substrate-binding protein [Pseudomonadota bacterium]